jgi:hypothetical protein
MNSDTGSQRLRTRLSRRASPRASGVSRRMLLYSMLRRAHTVGLVLILLLGFVVPVSAQTNDAQRALQLPTEYAVGTNSAGIAQADFNQDGIMDLAVTAQDGTVTILLGQSDGSFKSAATWLPEGASPYALLFTDVNSDGKPNLITGTSSNFNVQLG